MTRPRLTSRLAAVGLVALAGLAIGAAAAAGPRNPALPDRALTPGATNPAVTPATIHETIYVAGYTARIRPAEAYTERLKFRQLDEGYNVNGDTHASHYGSEGWGFESLRARENLVVRGDRTLGAGRGPARESSSRPRHRDTGRRAPLCLNVLFSGRRAPRQVDKLDGWHLIL